MENNTLKKIFTCPDCGKIFDAVNGLFVHCICGYVEDSTFNQITNWDKFKKLQLNEH